MSAFQASTFVYLMIKTILPKFFRPLVAALCSVFPVICAGSRYLDGYHHLHDIIVGAGLGIFIGYFVFNSTIRRDKPSKRFQIEGHQKLTSECI